MWTRKNTSPQAYDLARSVQALGRRGAETRTCSADFTSPRMSMKHPRIFKVERNDWWLICQAKCLASSLGILRHNRKDTNLRLRRLYKVHKFLTPATFKHKFLKNVSIPILPRGLNYFVKFLQMSFVMSKKKKKIFYRCL